MKNSKTTKSSYSDEDILKKLIELFQKQEKVRITYKIEKNKEAHYEKVKLGKVL